MHSSVASVLRGSCPTAEVGARLESLIPLVIGGGGPIAILDNGRCVGTISTQAAMAALVGDDGLAT